MQRCTHAREAAIGAQRIAATREARGREKCASEALSAAQKRRHEYYIDMRERAAQPAACYSFKEGGTMFAVVHRSCRRYPGHYATNNASLFARAPLL